MLEGLSLVGGARFEGFESSLEISIKPFSQVLIFVRTSHVLGGVLISPSKYGFTFSSCTRDRFCIYRIYIS